MGVRTDVADKIMFSTENGSNPKVNIERGDWTFYGIGYAGTTYVVGGNTYYKKLTGAISCGMSTVSIRGGQSTSINLNLSAEGCSGKLARTLKFHTTQVDRCDGFYNYDSNNNTFHTSADYFAGTTCISLPSEQQAITTYPYYKVSVLNMSNGTESNGISSPCRLYNSAADRLVLPIGLVPFRIKLYRTLDQCEANQAAHNVFDMRDGIETGNPQAFDHFIKQIAADKSDTRIVLPTAHTKRWKSPFMSMIPRILCDTGLDCFTSPTPITPDPSPLPSAYTGHVSWDHPKKNQLLLPDVTATSCEDLTYDSKYFGISDCEIKNGFLYGTVVRNELSCRPTAAPALNYYDLYERNDLIYILYTRGGFSKIDILSKAGNRLNTITLNTNTFRAVAATDDGEVYVSSEIDGTVSYLKNAAGTYIQNFNEPSLTSDEIELTPDGSMLFYVADDDNTILSSYQISTRSVLDETSYGSSVQKIQYYAPDAAIYTMNVYNQNDAGEMGSITLTPVAESTGLLGTKATISSAYSSISFHINSDKLFIYGIGDGPGHVITSVKSASGVWTTLNGLSGNSYLSTNGDKFIAVDGGVYAVDSGTNSMFTNKFKFNGDWNNVVASGTCIDSFSLKLGSQSTVVSLITMESPGTFSRNLTLFNSAFEMVGSRNVHQPFNHYLFGSLNKNQVKSSTSGKLELVQRLMGPQGVGGMLYEYSSCEQIRDLLNVSNEINKSFPVEDPYSGYRSYQINISKNNSVIPVFTCHDYIPNQTGCIDAYDMLIKVSSTGLFEKENYNLKLRCGGKKGELDYLRYNSTETEKALHYWNTSVESTARSDSYEMYQSAKEFSSQLTYITKTSDSDLRGRTVVLKKWSDLRMSYTLDYERDGIDHRVQPYSVTDTPAAFTANPFYMTWRTNSQYSGVAATCRPVSQSSLNGAVTTCAMNLLEGTNSRGLPLSMSAIENSDTPGVPFQNLFQISP